MNHKTRRMTQNIGVAILLVVGLGWIIAEITKFHSSNFTDNAQVKQLIVPVNSRIQGFIKEIRFDEYSEVKKGDTLVIIEDAEFRLQYAQALANLQNAVSGKSAMNTAISTTQNNISVTDAAIAEVKAQLDNAQKDFERFGVLLKDDAVTQQQYDAKETAYIALKAKYEMLTRQKQSTALTSQEQTHRLGQNDANINAAQAAVDLAELNLSYTVITAPCDGVTSRKMIQDGQLIQPGQVLLTLVDSNDIWVIANYRETQTADLCIGDSVEIKVDAIPGVVYGGYVEAVSQATGSAYSIIPQDNATGNFVKVEQRVPVKIRFTKNNDSRNMAKLRAGLNVECTLLK